ncbi:MAG TPA: MCE family protein, partial [Acidimicrobiales bacterium]|nr:MCE family protein [Acidimicrobiales bacterium]
RLGLASVLLAGVLVSLAASACSLVGGGTYDVSAHFADGRGLYQGIPVTERGVKIGKLAKVHNEGKQVVATMRIDKKYPLPAGADANVIGESVLGQRYIEFTPAYTGGPRLAAGANLPLARTSVPVTVDQFLSAFKNYLGNINPKNVSDVVTNLAQVLNGQGQKLNSLLHNAAGTFALLAAKGNQLGQLNGSLARLTGTLKTRDQAITQLLNNYNAVTGTLDANGAQLGGTIDNLNRAFSQVNSLLAPNLPGLKNDLSVITTSGRTLDRNLSNIDQTLGAEVKLFSGAPRVYSAQHNWLRLGLESNNGTTEALVEARIRDDLAGVCRRLYAHHSSGLSPQTIQTLKRCGNPNSGFFDPVLQLIPKLSNGKTITPQELLALGLNRIPGLSPAARHQIANQTGQGPPAKSRSTPPPSSTTTTTTPPSTTPPSTPPPSTPPPGGSPLPPLPPLFNAPGSSGGLLP